MDNLQNLNDSIYNSLIFNAIDEQQRKIQTPFIEPQDVSFQNSEIQDQVNQKLDSSLDEMTNLRKKKSRKIKTIENPNSNKKCGHWSPDENKRYHWFLELHQQHFFKKHLRRTDRIFKSMATFVQTREAEQCRSHHQKMQKKYKYFSKILISLREHNYGNQQHQQIINQIYLKDQKIDTSIILSCQQLRQHYSLDLKQQPTSSNELSQPFTPKNSTPKFDHQHTSTSLAYLHPYEEKQMDEEHKEQDQQELFGNIIEKQDNFIEDIFSDHDNKCKSLFYFGDLY